MVPSGTQLRRARGVTASVVASLLIAAADVPAQAPTYFWIAQTLTEPTESGTGSAVAVTRSGTITVVWRDVTDGSVKARSRRAGQPFTPAVTLSDRGDRTDWSSAPPAVTAGADGTTTVVWIAAGRPLVSATGYRYGRAADDIRLRTLPASGTTWSATETVPREPRTYSHRQVKELQLEPLPPTNESAGDTAIMWTDIAGGPSAGPNISQVWMTIRRRAPVEFEVPTPVSPPSTRGRIGNASIAVEPSGALRGVWVGPGASGYSTDNIVQTARRVGRVTAFSPADTLSLVTGGATAFLGNRDPRISVAANGAASVAWLEHLPTAGPYYGYTLRVARQTGVSSPWMTVDTGIEPVGPPSLIADLGGETLVVASRDRSHAPFTERVVAVSRDAGTIAFGSPQVLDIDTPGAAIGLSLAPDDTVTAAWITSKGEVKASLRPPGIGFLPAERLSASGGGREPQVASGETVAWWEEPGATAPDSVHVAQRAQVNLTIKPTPTGPVACPGAEKTIPKACIRPIEHFYCVEFAPPCSPPIRLLDPIRMPLFDTLIRDIAIDPVRPRIPAR